MVVVVQKVTQASVTISEKKTAKIGNGLLVLIGVENSDNQEDIDWLCKKIINMRIFLDEDGKMNKSLLDVGGKLLLVSQFTLQASTKKGNRPSYIKAAKPEISVPLYEAFIRKMQEEIGTEKVQTGTFGANMQIALINDGPVTIHMDSKDRK